MATRAGTTGARALAAALLPLTVACSGAADAGDDAGSVPRYEAVDPGPRIGSVDDSAYAFASVTELVEGPDGTLYSLHRAEQAVRRWTPDGRADGRIGRAGEGPGEFQSPRYIGLFGDSLWVVDLRAYRASFFGPDGELRGAVTPGARFASREDGPTASPPRPQRPRRDGLWYGVKPAWSEEIARGRLTDIPHVVMDAEGDVVDTTWVQVYRPSDILALLNEDQPGGSFGAQPFGDDALTEPDDDGTLVVVDRRVPGPEARGSAEVYVTRLAPDGDTLSRVAVPYPLRPLPRERVDSAVRTEAGRFHEFLARVQPGTALGDTERRFAEATHVPAWLPAVREMVVGTDGAVWLRRFDPEGDRDVWWVVDPEDGLERAVELPTGFRLMVAAPDHVWGVETDELDVNYIVRYEVRPVTDT